MKINKLILTIFNLTTLFIVLSTKKHLIFAFFDEYQETVAYKAAILSSVTYASHSDIKRWDFLNPDCAKTLERFVIDKVFLDPTLTALAFSGVEKEEERVVVAFKGTNNTFDLVTDTQDVLYFTEPCIIGNSTLGNIHSGFCSYYKQLAVLGLPERVLDLLKAYPSYQVLLTGHSLGGAAASLLALDLFLRYGVRSILYTFGQPRTGDFFFAERLSQACLSVWRVVHRSDMIAHLPLCCHSLTWSCRQTKHCPHHSQNQVWYNNDMAFLKDAYRICEGNGENTTCQHTVDLSIPDHLFYFQKRLGRYCKFTRNISGQHEFEKTATYDTK